MSLFTSFAFSEQGFNHIKANKECQDASGCYSDDVMTLVVVADGHGSDNYPRTAKGSEYAVASAKAAIREFVYAVKANEIPIDAEHEREVNERFRALEANLLKRWHDAVDEDVIKHPFQEDELKKVSQKYRLRYQSGDYNAKAYGTTLIAVCITHDYWFGIQIGDGKCVCFSTDGESSEPIPWDDACQMNVTTSICDEDALDEFRSFFSNELPLAVFVGSDGIDDSYAGEDELHAVYRAMVGIFAEYGETVGKQEVQEFLPKTSRKGSGDDVSIAGAIQASIDPETLELLNAIADYKAKTIRFNQVQRDMQLALEKYQYISRAVAGKNPDDAQEKEKRAKESYDNLAVERENLSHDLQKAENKIVSLRKKTLRTAISDRSEAKESERCKNEDGTCSETSESDNTYSESLNLAAGEVLDDQSEGLGEADIQESTDSKETATSGKTVDEAPKSPDVIAVDDEVAIVTSKQIVTEKHRKTEVSHEIRTVLLPNLNTDEK